MNGYARLSHVMADLVVQGQSAKAELAPIYQRSIDSVSREFEGECAQRRFYSRTATRYYTGEPCQDGIHRMLWLADDLATVTALTIDRDGDGTYETTLAVNTDYWLWPYDAAEKGWPYRAIELNPNGSLTVWPVWPPRAIKVAGLFGWPRLTESGGTLGEALDATETEVTLGTDSTVEAGDTIVVDDEEIAVTALESLTATVERGVNGSTAATHADAAPVLIRRYPADIEEAVRLRVTQTRWDSNSGTPLGGIEGLGRGDVGHYARYRDVAQRYTPPGVP